MSSARPVDPRGLRFTAAVTASVLATVLLTSSAPLLIWQTAAFAATVCLGVGSSPYGQIFRWVVRPRLGPPADLEDPRPPRFAALVGLVFTVVALGALLAGAQTPGLIAVGAAFAAALLNATTGFCLGCELYVVLVRTTSRLLRRRAGGGASSTALATAPATAPATDTVTTTEVSA